MLVGEYGGIYFPYNFSKSTSGVRQGFYGSFLHAHITKMVKMKYIYNWKHPLAIGNKRNFYL